MTILKPSTKKAKSMIQSYNYYLSRNMGNSLYEIYDRPSQAKENALNYCKSLKEQLNGYNACFCGYNCMIFTYAFLFIKDNKTYLAYITPSYDYAIEYNE